MIEIQVPKVGVNKTVEDIKEFKKGIIFKALEQAVLIGEDIREREEEIDGFRKLELESD
jgi:hypothetical protein